MVAVDDTHGAFLNVDGIFEVLLMFGWLYVLGFSLIYDRTENVYYLKVCIIIYYKLVQKVYNVKE